MLRRLIRDFWPDEDGLTTVEYALLLLLIVMVGPVAWTGFGSTISNKVTDANNRFASGP